MPNLIYLSLLQKICQYNNDLGEGIVPKNIFQPIDFNTK
jgi:hypothetical protein